MKTWQSISRKFMNAALSSTNGLKYQNKWKVNFVPTQFTRQYSDLTTASSYLSGKWHKKVFCHVVAIVRKTNTQKHLFVGCISSFFLNNYELVRPLKSIWHGFAIFSPCKWFQKMNRICQIWITIFACFVRIKVKP